MVYYNSLLSVVLLKEGLYYFYIIFILFLLLLLFHSIQKQLERAMGSIDVICFKQVREHNHYWLQKLHEHVFCIHAAARNFAISLTFRW